MEQRELLQSQLMADITNYPALRDAKAAQVIRLQQGHYQLVFSQFDSRTRQPLPPQIVLFDREFLKQLVEGLNGENARLQAKVDANNMAIKHLTETLPAEIGELDKAAD